MEKKDEIETIKIEIDGESKMPSKKWETKRFSPPYHYIYSSSHDNNFSLSKIEGHPVLMGYYKAYSEHLPMVISPDIFWQLILLGFAQHVDQCFESLRNQFVDFKGKKKIKVERLNLTPQTAKKEDWEDIVNEFCSKISNNVSQDLINILTPNFSTTNNISKTSCQLSIMSSMKHYFDFECRMCGCGIPYIIIEGTLNDWIELKKKAENLQKYDLKWWIDKLIPNLDKIIETKQGKVDKEFLRNIIKVNKQNVTRYGPSGMKKWTEKSDFISGWILSFFPYDCKGCFTNLTSIEFDKKNDIADHMCDTPMDLVLLSLDITLNTVFKSGFIGVQQDEKTLAVKPVIGWYLVNESEKSTFFKPHIIH